MPLNLIRHNIHFLLGQSNSKSLDGPFLSPKSPKRTSWEHTNWWNRLRASPKEKALYQCTLPKFLLFYSWIGSRCYNVQTYVENLNKATNEVFWKEAKIENTYLLDSIYPFFKNPGKLHILDSIWWRKLSLEQRLFKNNVCVVSVCLCVNMHAALCMCRSEDNLR